MSKLDNFKIDYSDTWESVKDKLNGVIDYCAEYFDNKMNNSTNGIITESDGVTEKLYLVNPENVKIISSHNPSQSTFESASLPLGETWTLIERHNSMHAPIESPTDIMASTATQSLKKSVLAISAHSYENYYCIFRTQYRDETYEEIDFICDLSIKNTDGSISHFSASKSNTGVGELDTSTETYKQFVHYWRTMNEYDMSISVNGNILAITAYIPVVVGLEVMIYEETFEFDLINNSWINPTIVNQEIIINNLFVILKAPLQDFPSNIIDYVPINEEIESVIYRGLVVAASSINNEYTVNLSNFSGVISSKSHPVYSTIPPKIFNIDGKCTLVYKPSVGYITISEITFGNTFNERTIITDKSHILCEYSDHSIISMNAEYLILSSSINNCLVLHNLVDSSAKLIPMGLTNYLIESTINPFDIYSDSNKQGINKYFYKNIIHSSHLIILKSQFTDFIVDTQSKTITSHSPLRLTTNNIAVKYDINSTSHKFYYEWVNVESMRRIQLISGNNSLDNKIVTNILGLRVAIYNPSDAILNAVNPYINKVTIYNSPSPLNITNRLTGKNHE